MSDTSLTNNIIEASPEEKKLQHEVDYLKSRVTNLEVFKKNFFNQHYELLEARDRISELEERLSLESVKGNILDNSVISDIEVEESTDELLEYFHEALTAASFQDLVMSLFSAAKDVASDISLLIYDVENQHDFNTNPDTHKLNLQNILDNNDKGETVKLAGKTLYNYKHLSLIYTNDQQDEQCNRYMEILTLGANSRISNIKQRHDMEQLRKNIYKIFRKTNQSFSDLQDNIETNTINVSMIFESCRTSVITNLKKMSLNEKHLELLELIMDESRSELLLELTSAMSLDNDFMDVMKRLEQAYAKEYAGD